MSETIKRAEGRWPDILARLGVDEQFLRNRHGPCPICGGTDRYRFDDKGLGSYYCSGCGPGFGIDLLMKIHGWDFAAAAREVDSVVGSARAVPERQAPDPRIRLNFIRRELQPVGGSINPVRLYLKNRGFTEVPRSVKFHPSMRYYEQGVMTGEHPAMVALVTSHDGKPVTYHVTHLDKYGRKAAVPSVKKMLPPARTLQGSAIRLTEVMPHIGVAEGIETAMAVMRDYGLPCWATMTAGLMEAFQPPEGVTRVTVFADNDANFQGHRAAYILANRLAKSKSPGYIVSVKVPTEHGDFADKKIEGES